MEIPWALLNVYFCLYLSISTEKTCTSENSTSFTVREYPVLAGKHQAPGSPSHSTKDYLTLLWRRWCGLTEGRVHFCKKKRKKPLKATSISWRRALIWHIIHPTAVQGNTHHSAALLAACQQAKFLLCSTVWIWTHLPCLNMHSCWQCRSFHHKSQLCCRSSPDFNQSIQGGKSHASGLWLCFLNLLQWCGFSVSNHSPQL